MNDGQRRYPVPSIKAVPKDRAWRLTMIALSLVEIVVSLSIFVMFASSFKVQAQPVSPSKQLDGPGEFAAYLMIAVLIVALATCVLALARLIGVFGFKNGCRWGLIVIAVSSALDLLLCVPTSFGAIGLSFLLLNGAICWFCYRRMHGEAPPAAIMDGGGKRSRP